MPADRCVCGTNEMTSNTPHGRGTLRELPVLKGMGVNPLARQFEVHRGTVWTKTRGSQRGISKSLYILR